MRKGSKQPSADQDIALLVAMLRYASLISRPMRDGVADPAGLSSNELRILIALAGEGDSAGHDLAELMGMHAMNVSRALASLKRMGLVEPVKNAANRRRRPFRLTARGNATRAALETSLGRVARFVLGTLSAKERQALAGTLAKLDRQVRAWAPETARSHVRRA